MFEWAAQCEFMGFGPITNADCHLFVLATQPLCGCFSMFVHLLLEHICFFFGVFLVTSKKSPCNAP